jgi:hypothetical protein
MLKRKREQMNGQLEKLEFRMQWAGWQIQFLKRVMLPRKKLRKEHYFTLKKETEKQLKKNKKTKL